MHFNQYLIKYLVYVKNNNSRIEKDLLEFN